VQFNEHIWYIDNGLLNAPGFGSTYLLRGDALAIVETGTSLCAPRVLDGLRRLGVRPAEVRHILLTHIHMDHAGGTGTLLPHMPAATVYIHSRTAKYLVQPADLLRSAERALGPLFAAHGTVEPIAADRIVHADQLRLDLGRGVVLEAIATPGHSPDHLAYYEATSRSLFSGDSLGIELPRYGYAGPVTPPPAFDLERQRETFRKLLELDAASILFSHWGPGQQPVRASIERSHQRLEMLVALVREQWQAGDIDPAAAIALLLPRPPAGPRERQAIEGWIDMSVRGLALYFERTMNDKR